LLDTVALPSHALMRQEDAHHVFVRRFVGATDTLGGKACIAKPGWAEQPRSAAPDVADVLFSSYRNA